jgi:hypothetical protein
MDRILDSQNIENLAIIVEEATRSSEEGVKRFIEPVRGTLRRTISKRHHIVFGRRGSGKSSLLLKAAADLTIDRRPIAYVDLETFKWHSYPDVLLSVLISSYEEFSKWLETAAIHPSHKTSFWHRLFGTKPQRPPFDRKQAGELASVLRNHVKKLNIQLHSPDNVETHKTIKFGQETIEQGEVGAQIGLDKIGISGKLSDAEKSSSSEEVQEAFHKSKVDFLNRHIVEYQNLFRQISMLSGGDSYLFLDDLYHIKRTDQAKVIDYFHRIAKGNRLWLKVGTIRHRTQWYIHGNPPFGVKLGDDADDIDLDLTLEKYSLAKDFLVKILKLFLNDCEILIKQILTDGAIDRLILASGGVARDFLGVFKRSIDIARDRQVDHRGPKIGVEDVNLAAGEYDSSKREEFERDTLDDKPMLENEFQRIRDFCTRKSKTNVFLLDKDAAGKEIAFIHELVDLRLLHLVRSRVTVSGRPGRIFEAYMLDASQYTGSRKMRGLEIIELWRPDSVERLRRASLIYAPSE